MRKLNIGCGPFLLDGWVNADLHPLDPRVLRMDATETWPFSANEFDRVFSEHMIEHVPYEGARMMLQEAYRTLKPGGRIRISTPNLGFLMYLLNHPNEELNSRYIKWASESFCPGQPVAPETVINNFVRAWGHQYIHTWQGLGDLMMEVGFVNLSGESIGDSLDPEFVGLENIERMPPGFLELETMVIEAAK